MVKSAAWLKLAASVSSLHLMLVNFFAFKLRLHTSIDANSLHLLCGDLVALKSPPPCNITCET